jgi:AraC-like DNA-binding protein
MKQSISDLERIHPRLNNLWRGAWRRGAVEPGRYLCDHELVAVTDGSCQVTIGRKSFELGPGSYLIVPPNRYHVTRVEKGRVYRHCVHFDWLRADRRYARKPMWFYHPARPGISDVKRAPQFIPRKLLTGRFDLAGPVPLLLETLFQYWQSGRAKERAIACQIMGQLLIQLLWPEARAFSLDRSSRLAYEIKELIDRNRNENIALRPLLASLGFSCEHLSRLFKRKFGLSPAKYRNSARLEQAKSLLLDPKRTIAFAAYEVGFSDPAYFSRKFRQSYGVAPRQFQGQGDQT